MVVARLWLCVGVVIWLCLLTQVEAVSFPASPKLDLTGYKLVFYDDFTTFNWYNPKNKTGVWQSYYNYPARTLSGNAELEYYSDITVGVDPFILNNGILELQANPSWNLTATQNLPYTSGVITTFPSFTQIYGYFEIRWVLLSALPVFIPFVISVIYHFYFSLFIFFASFLLILSAPGPSFPQAMECGRLSG